jgi:N-acetylneuraminate synthase/N,N'-diacetyllegionaminate synthase
VSGTLFLIPARGGSRRIPGKNVRLLAGIPLVGWAARIARSASVPGDVVLCSTDEAAIAEAAETWGARVLDRPADLATDSATSVDVALHAIEVLEGQGEVIDRLVLVQPTSPLTDPADLAAAIALARDTDRSVASVTETHPATWHHRLDADRVLHPVEVEDATHLLTGAFYVTTPADLRRSGRFVEAGRTLGFATPPDRAIDIDEPLDLDLAADLLARRPIPPFRFGGHEIQPGRTFVIAEAGVNHDGDVEVAHRLVDAAADAAADAVKFQTFVPEALAAASAPTAAYQRASEQGDDQRAMLARLALGPDAWHALQAHASDKGILFLSAPFDDASADLLDSIDVPGFKVGSGELTNLPFLGRLARKGRPMIVSTGMATMPEVAAAVDAIRATGLSHLALLHCVSAYPAVASDANLRAMATMRGAFGLQTGWSDHTPGIELPVAATTLGAAIIEKHLTLDRGRRGPDHAMSLEPAVFAGMVQAIRAAESAIGGDGTKRPTDAEREVAAVARRSLHWARDLAAGGLIEEDDLVAQRPGTGLSPARTAALVGRRTTRVVRAGTLVREDDI